MMNREKYPFAATAFAFSTALALSVTIGSVGLAHAESVPEKPASPESSSPKISKAKPAFEFAKDLDGLFGQLKRTRDIGLAERISTRIWEEWQSSDSKSVDLLTRWARVAMGKQRFSKALDLLDQVVVLRPKYAEGYNQRATLHFMMQDFGKSIADIERTLALEPRHYGALSGLAGILERLGQKEKALETWYRALNVYPTMRNAQESVLRLEEELEGKRI